MSKLTRLSLLSICLFGLFTTALGKPLTGTALFEQAKSYHDGVGVPQNYEQARVNYLKAVSVGNSDAMLNLGYMYFVGEGVTIDYKQARRWYERAAAQGDQDALANLAMMDKRGLGLMPEHPDSERKSMTVANAKTPTGTLINDSKMTSKSEYASNTDANSSHIDLSENKLDSRVKVVSTPSTTKVVSSKQTQITNVKSNRVIASKSVHRQTSSKSPKTIPRMSLEPIQNYDEIQSNGVIAEKLRARFNSNKSTMVISGQIKNIRSEAKDIPNMTLTVLDQAGDTLKRVPLKIDAKRISPYQTVSVRQVVRNLPAGSASVEFKMASTENTLKITGIVILALLLVGVLFMSVNWMQRRHNSQTLFVI